MATGRAQSLQHADGKFSLKNKIRLRIKHGDITKFPFDAVVVGENRGFDGQGAIARSLLRSGGPLYKGARDNMIREAQLPSNAKRLVFVSEAGEKFKFKKVFHAIVGSRKHLPHDNWYKHLEQLFTEVGKMAEKNKIAQVCTPLLGTGAARGDVDVSLQAAITALANLSPKHLEDVIIVEYEAQKAVMLGEKLKDFFRLHPEFLYDDEKNAPAKRQAPPRPPPPRQEATPGPGENKPSSPSDQSGGPTAPRRRLPKPPADNTQGDKDDSSHGEPRPAPRSRKNGGSPAALEASRPGSGEGGKQKVSDSSGSSTPRRASQKKRPVSASPAVTPQSASSQGRDPNTGAPAASELRGNAVPPHHNNNNNRKNDLINEERRGVANKNKKLLEDMQRAKENRGDSLENASSRDERGTSQVASTDVDEVTCMLGNMSVDDKNKRVRSAGSNKGRTGQTQQTMPSSQPPGFSPGPSQAGYPPQGPPYPQQWNWQYPSDPTPHQLAQLYNQSCNMWQQHGQAAFPIPPQKEANMSEAEWIRRLFYVWTVVQQQVQNSPQVPYGWNPNVLPQPGQTQHPVPHQGYPMNENKGHPVPQGQNYDGNAAGVSQLQPQPQVQQGLNPGYGPGPQAPQPQRDFPGDGRQRGTTAGNTTVFTVRAPLRDGRDGQEDTLQGRRSATPEEHHQAGERGKGRQGLYPDLTNVEKHSSQPPPQSRLAGQGAETQTNTQASRRGDSFVSPSSNVPCSEASTAPSPAEGRQRPDREPGQQVMDRGDHRPSPDRRQREDLAGNEFLESWRESNLPRWAQGHVSGDDSQEFVELPVDRSHAERETSPPPQPHSPRHWAEEQLESQSQDRVQSSNRLKARKRMEESAHRKDTMEDSEEEEQQQQQEEEDEEEPGAEHEEDQKKEGQRRDENQSSGSHRGRSQRAKDDLSSREIVEREAQDREPTSQPQTDHEHRSRESGDRTPDDKERPSTSRNRPEEESRIDRKEREVIIEKQGKSEVVDQESSSRNHGQRKRIVQQQLKSVSPVKPDKESPDRTSRGQRISNPCWDEGPEVPDSLQEERPPATQDDPSLQGENEMRRRRQKHENPETKPGTSESPPVREDEAEEDEHNEGSRKTTAQEQSSMPEGKMATVVKENVHLEGFKPTCGTIVIEYSFANGVQQEGHPAPGQPYKGTFRRAFLPDNQKGQRVLQLLQTAFDRKLTFRLQQTGPDGEWVMEFADIPHKTSLKGGSKGNGYPDPEYLQLVETILESLGIK